MNSIVNSLALADPIRPGFYPAQAPLLAEPIVLFHGWGCDSRIWGDFARQLHRDFHLHIIDLPGFGDNDHLPCTLESLWPLLPKRAFYLGWSLGGMLAVQVAALQPARVVGVISLAANAKFIADVDWPSAMPAATFTEFAAGVDENLAATLKRFAQLCGSGLARPQLVQLRNHMQQAVAEAPTKHYAAGLQWLASLDNRALLTGLSVPSLHLFARQDQLVPFTAMANTKALVNQAPVPGEVLAIDAGHTLFLENTAEVCAAIKEFALRHQQQRNKQQVARSFSRAAVTYDAVAGLQRRIGEQLLSWLIEHNPPQKVATLLDLGSGTGYFAQPLARAFPAARVISLDLAEGMLRFAQEAGQGEMFCAGDAESLPFADNSLDSVFSSLAVQWCENHSAVLTEILRTLKPGGVAAIATLGVGTMAELQQAWQGVDGYQHVNTFTAAEVWQAQAMQLGFRQVQHLSCNKTEYFANLKQLSHSLKALGAHNVNAGQAAGLTGKRKLKILESGLEQLRTPQGLPLSYCVEYFILLK